MESCHFDLDELSFLKSTPRSYYDIAKWFGIVNGEFKYNPSSMYDVFQYVDFKDDLTFKPEQINPFKFLVGLKVKSSQDSDEITKIKYVGMIEDRLKELYWQGVRNLCLSGGFDSTMLLAVSVKLGLDFVFVIDPDYIKKENFPCYEFVKKNCRCVEFDNLVNGRKVQHGSITGVPAKLSTLDKICCFFEEMIPEWVSVYTQKIGLDVSPKNCAAAINYGFGTSWTVLGDMERYNFPVFFFHTRDFYKFSLSHASQLIGMNRLYYKEYIGEVLDDEILEATHRNSMRGVSRPWDIGVSPVFVNKI